MANVLKQTFDIKTVVIIVVYVAGLVANNVKQYYSNKIADKDQEAIYQEKFTALISTINKLESKIDKKDALLDRDILEIKNQQAADELTDKAQNFLLDNIHRNMNK